MRLLHSSKIDARKQKLARRHLSLFFQHRARELRPGAELLLLMVGRPDSKDQGSENHPKSQHGICPPGDDDGGPCPLTIAMQRLVQEGTLRAEIWERIRMAYDWQTTLTTTEDNVKEAYGLALETEEGCLLELVDIRSYQSPIILIGEGTDTIDGAYEWFWAIHRASVASAGPHPKELEHIQIALRQVFDEMYDPQTGLTATFVACVFRRRTRKRWSSTKGGS